MEPIEPPEEPREPPIDPIEPPEEPREPPIDPIEPPEEPREPPIDPIEPPEEPIEPPIDPIEPPEEPIEPPEEPIEPALPPAEGIETGGPPDGEDMPPVVLQPPLNSATESARETLKTPLIDFMPLSPLNRVQTSITPPPGSQSFTVGCASQLSRRFRYSS